jgi:hypothetical protein
MIYYISGTSNNSDLDVTKIMQEISGNNVFITDLSMLEICTRYRTNLATLKEIIKSLIDLNYPVIPCLKNGHKITRSNLISALKDDVFLNFIVNDSFEKKIEFESMILDFLSKNIATVNLTVNHNKDSNNIISFANNLEKASSHRSDKLRVILHDFYNDDDTRKFKDSVVEYILDLCEIYVYMYHVSDKGLDLFEFFEKFESHPEELKRDIFKKISNDKSLKYIKDRKSQKKGLICKEFIQELDKQLKHYNEKVSAVSNCPTTINYYTILFKKILTLEAKKLEKNDIIDSQLLGYYPNYLILTADKNFIKFINEIDKNYATQINTILTKCKA